MYYVASASGFITQSHRGDESPFTCDFQKAAKFETLEGATETVEWNTLHNRSKGPFVVLSSVFTNLSP